MKASGRSGLFKSVVSQFPVPKVPNQALNRALRLSCLTIEYQPIWDKLSNIVGDIDWSQKFPKVCSFDSSSSEWSKFSAIRCDFYRRLALLELDVLVSMSFNFSLDELIELYRTYFPVLQENDAGTWYDQNGRIVWTCSKGLTGVGYLTDRGTSPSRKEWESILETNPTELFCTAIDNTRPGGPYTVERRFVGPFFKCDRVEDYKRAWAHFEKLEQESKL